MVQADMRARPVFYCRHAWINMRTPPPRPPTRP